MQKPTTGPSLKTEQGNTRSLAVAERLCDAACYSIFCQVTRGHLKWHRSKACVWLSIHIL